MSRQPRAPIGKPPFLRSRCRRTENVLRRAEDGRSRIPRAVMRVMNKRVYLTIESIANMEYKQFKQFQNNQGIAHEMFFCWTCHVIAPVDGVRNHC